MFRLYRGMPRMKRALKNILSVEVLLLALISCDNMQPNVKPVNKDDYYEKCRKLVVSENIIGQEFIFNKSGKTIDKLNILYLGIIKTAQGDTLKFLNSVNYCGQYEDARKAKGAVFIYDNQNQKIGAYYLGGALDVPQKIEGTNLIFSYNGESCSQTTIINFKDSIPQQIFINCTDKGGDLYSFSKD